jgi:hypothetical protein
LEAEIGKIMVGPTNYLAGWCPTMIFPISASKVTRIISVRHQHPVPSLLVSTFNNDL